MTERTPFIIRQNDDDSIDEIAACGCNIHIEQMTPDGWFLGINASDGSYWQFWFGSKNRKTPVEFRHVEMTPALVKKQRRKGRSR